MAGLADFSGEGWENPNQGREQGAGRTKRENKEEGSRHDSVTYE